MNDTRSHSMTGKLCSTQDGCPIVWSGHLCVGANLTPPSVDNFCLWTLCGEHDVPCNSANEGTIEEVTCVKCAEIFAPQSSDSGEAK